MFFRIILLLIGLALSLGSRISPRVRSQLSRDMVFVMESLDGVSRSFTMRGRRITSHSGVSTDAVCTVRFRTAAIGARIFLAKDAIGQLIDGFSSLDVECQGEAAHVLWFYELAMGLLPWHKSRTEIWPQSYAEPDLSLKASTRIIREPSVDSLDPAWADAAEQRNKLVIWQVGKGAVPTGKIKNHKIVVNLATAHQDSRK
jgi:hypothetical protein